MGGDNLDKEKSVSHSLAVGFSPLVAAALRLVKQTKRLMYPLHSGVLFSLSTNISNVSVCTMDKSYRNESAQSLHNNSSIRAIDEAKDHRSPAPTSGTNLTD